MIVSSDVKLEHFSVKSNVSLSERGIELALSMNKKLNNDEEREAFRKFLFSPSISFSGNK